MMKKVLITGSSGYIGSHLSKLLEKDYEVHGLDIREPQVHVKEFYNIDINRHFTLEHEYDAVVHLAALVNVNESQRNPIMYYITNLNGTMNVLNKTKTKNFIQASTGAAVSCNSAYGISKRAAEDIVREFYNKHGLEDYTIFRFYNVIGSTVVGPTNPDGLMYNLMRAKETGEFTIFGKDYNTYDGTCIRDYVHVEEICDSIRTAIEKPSNQIESLGHGEGRSVLEMVHLFEDVNNVRIDIKYAPRRDGDVSHSVLKGVSPYMKNLYTLEQLLKV